MQREAPGTLVNATSFGTDYIVHGIYFNIRFTGMMSVTVFTMGTRGSQCILTDSRKSVIVEGGRELIV